MGRYRLSAADRDELLSLIATLRGSDAWERRIAQYGWHDAYLPADEYAEFLAIEDERTGRVLARLDRG